MHEAELGLHAVGKSPLASSGSLRRVWLVHSHYKGQLADGSTPTVPIVNFVAATDGGVVQDGADLVFTFLVTLDESPEGEVGAAELVELGEALLDATVGLLALLLGVLNHLHDGLVLGCSLPSRSFS